MSFFPEKEDIPYFLGLCNSKVIKSFLKIIAPTLNFQAGDVAKLPIKIDSSKKEFISNLSNDNVKLSIIDWDSFETSRDFKGHPYIVNKSNSLKNSYSIRNEKTKTSFNQLKNNEEELNKIFNEIYGLGDEIDPAVEDKSVTIRLADRNRDSKSLLSYIIGCMVGRYSLDQEGLVYAGGTFDLSKYKTFEADDDGILPVLYDSYFEDDVVDRTKEFVKKVWGDENFDENWVWLAQSIDEGSSKSADEIIRNYYNKSFMEDHFNTYQKRPIYRYFVSNSKKPKESAFKCIVYLHRYNKDTISIIRSKYLYKFQSKLEEELARLSKEDSRTAEKRCEEIRKQLIELGDYDKLLKDFADKNIELDLDDGVKVNYTKLMDAGIVAKLKI